MVLNLFLYAHWLASFLNLVVWYNAPTVYFVQEDGHYVKMLGNEVLVDSQQNLVSYSDPNSKYYQFDYVYGQLKYYNQTDWIRWTPEDALGWEIINARWEARAT